MKLQNVKHFTYERLYCVFVVNRAASLESRSSGIADCA